MFSRVCVCLFTGEWGPKVTITHDALDGTYPTEMLSCFEFKDIK